MANTPEYNLKKIDDKSAKFNQKLYYEDNFDIIDTALSDNRDNILWEAGRVDLAEDEIGNLELNKVDKVAGKVLSTNDYTTPEKSKVTNLPLNTLTDLGNKVDKVTGKGLSTNDFTNTLKSKLETEIPAQLGEIATGEGINNSAINQEKLAFTSLIGAKAKNLFDKLTAIAGYYVRQSDGALIASANYFASYWIPVQPSTQYIRNFTGQMAFYNSKKIYISGSDVNPFTTPATCAYVRLSIPNATALTTAQMELGAIVTAYVEGGNKVRETDILNETIKLNHMSKALKNELTKQVKFGFDSSFKSALLWTNATSGTSLISVIANTGMFSDGDYYTSFYRGNTNIVNSNFEMEIPEGYKYNPNRKVRVLIAYSSTSAIAGTLAFAQKTRLNAWCNPNTSVSAPLPNTNGKEVFIEVIIPVLWDGFKILPLLTHTGAVGTSINIGSMRFSILGNESSDEDNAVNIRIGTDYATIEQAIAFVNGTTGNKTYKIYIPDGVYNEKTLTLTKHNVIITGENEFDTIIYVDGALQSELAEANRHGIRCMRDTKVSNLTISVKNVKYCVHNDGDSTAYTANFKNCTFIKDVSVNTGFVFNVGIGAFANQWNIFEECTFINTIPAPAVNPYGMIWHNWHTDQVNASCGVIMKNCNFLNCGYVSAGELGSIHTDGDIIKIENCHTNKNYGIRVYVDKASTGLTTSAQALDVPHRIKLIVTANVPKLELENREEKYYKNVYPWVDANGVIITTP